MFGFLNIYKPIGMTSHDVVAVLRKILKVKQIGHTGTLDPFAQGVLPIAIGKATRLIEYLPDDKEYLATVQFGKSTNTYDIDGETTFESDKKISEQEVIENLKDFQGEIEQLPPIFSAIKVKGKKLYEYARKGEDVEIQPRKVTIYNIELKSFNFDLQQAQILIKCSKGTYIRSIANDLGKVIGCGGHLIRLVRTQAGKFRIEAAKQLGSEVAKLEDRKVGGQEVKPINSSDVTEIQQKQQNDKNPSTLQPFNTSTDLISPLEVLDLPIVEVDDEDLKKVKNGISINLKDNSQFTVHCSQIVLLLYNKEKICAIGQIENDKIKLKKVFL